MSERVPSIQILFHNERPIDPLSVKTLYTSNGWWTERSEQEIAKVLNSFPAVGAWDEQRLVGFARAVTDGHFRAFIEDVMVHPQYQRLGIGHQLLNRLCEALRKIETISLFCEPDLITFYEQLGFNAYPLQRVMHRKHLSQ
jgi:ribosomal protein S18 acetylase RimI-like enzyme